MGMGSYPDEEQLAKAQKVYSKDTSSEGLYTGSQLAQLGLTDQYGQDFSVIQFGSGLFNTRGYEAVYYLDSDVQTEFSSDDTDAEGNQYGQTVTYGSDGSESTTTNKKQAYRLRSKAVSSFKRWNTNPGQDGWGHFYKYYLEPVDYDGGGGGSTYSVGNEAQGGNLDSGSIESISNNNSGILTSSGYTKKQSTLGAAEGGILGTALGSMLSTALFMSGMNEMNKKSKLGG